jgi:hypothetical protein
MKKFNLIVLLIFSLQFFTSCQSVKQSFSPDKRKGDEFLVKKKNPLVLPPDFEDLPVPKSEQLDETMEEEEINIKEKLGLDNKVIKKDSKSSSEGSIEKSILEKIN